QGGVPGHGAAGGGAGPGRHGADRGAVMAGRLGDRAAGRATARVSRRCRSSRVRGQRLGQGEFVEVRGVPPSRRADVAVRPPLERGRHPPPGARGLPQRTGRFLRI
ncbi:MAG: hypothetical protein D6708_12245, partial [Candidatus Dadabacteria bacterium]